MTQETCDKISYGILNGVSMMFLIIIYFKEQKKKKNV